MGCLLPSADRAPLTALSVGGRPLLWKRYWPGFALTHVFTQVTTISMLRAVEGKNLFGEPWTKDYLLYPFGSHLIWNYPAEIVAMSY